MFGFVFYCYTAPMQGQNRHLSLIIDIPYTEKAYHCHHWNYLLCVFPFAYWFQSQVLMGFCMGGIIQSFCWYDDNFQIIIPRESIFVHHSEGNQPVI